PVLRPVHRNPLVPPTTRAAPISQHSLTSDTEAQHTEHMRYEERAKLTAVKALIQLAVLVASPVLLIAGAPIRGRCLRYVYRDEAPQILDKKRGAAG
ncbi:hypothetical protein WB403_48695, partial [Streptomyces brasiliscabiei]